MQAINISSLRVEHRDSAIFYANSELILYKAGQYLRLENCSGDLAGEVLCPQDDANVHALEFPDCVALLVGGQKLVLLDKSGFDPIQHDLSNLPCGKIMTSPFRIDDEHLLVGCVRNQRSQFAVINVTTGELVIQSQSWNTSQVNDLAVGRSVFGLLDKTFIVSLNLKTLETEWVRFETGLIAPKLVVAPLGTCYVAGGVLRIANEGKSESLLIPRFSPSAAVTSFGSTLVLVSDERTTLVGFDLERREVLWDISGSQKIMESLPVSGLIKSKLVNAVLLRYKDYIAAVDLERGHKLGSYPIADAFRMTQTSDHVIIHRRGGKSDLIAG